MSSALRLDEVFCSPEVYLAGEEQSQIKHEYLNGAVYAMSGASRAHNQVARNLLKELTVQLKGKPCEPFGSDMRLRIRQDGRTFYYYPDASVDCSNSKADEVEHPTVLFEVLSPNTDRIDRGDKLLNYQQIGSLRAYVILDQARPLATLYRRDAKGDWTMALVHGLANSLELPEIGCSLSMEQIYDRGFSPPRETTE